VMFDGITRAFGKTEAGSSRGAARRDEHSTAQQHLAGARILLVEDNEINQEVALELLSNAGIIAEVANNGQEALEILEKEDFDGVLMDMQMPVMDGVTATRAIRRRKQLGDLPVIAMTANAMAGDRDRCLQAGMQDHIAKPINVHEMFTTMAKWIKPKEPLRDVTRPQVHTDEGPLPEHEGLNLAAGLASVQGNEKLYARLLARFLREQRNFHCQFRAALDAADPKEATRLAHTLKGVAGTLGVQKTQEEAARLEVACGEGAGQEAIETCLADVERALGPALAAIEHWQGTQTDERVPEGQPKTADVQPLFERLHALLAEHDADAIDVVDEIMEAIDAGEQDPRLARLQTLVQDFDFEPALGLLKELAPTA